jgi:transposase
VSALAGVATMARDSGRYRGKRHDGAVRHGVRHVIYMATLLAVTHNPVLQRFHQRRIAAVKPPKVALVACMRKLIVILNVIARDHAPWNPEGLRHAS